MNKDKVRAWVEALRSGEYRQGRDRLATVDNEAVNYCCLGVACEVAIKDGLNLDRTVVDGDDPDIDVSVPYVLYDTEPNVLPSAVRQWLGVKDDIKADISDIDGPWTPTDWSVIDPTYRSVIKLNDGGWTFDMIAQALENTYLKEDK